MSYNYDYIRISCNTHKKYLYRVFEYSCEDAYEVVRRNIIHLHSIINIV